MTDNIRMINIETLRCKLEVYPAGTSLTLEPWAGDKTFQEILRQAENELTFFLKMIRMINALLSPWLKKVLNFNTQNCSKIK